MKKLFLTLCILSLNAFSYMPANAANLDVPTVPYPTILAAITAAGAGDNIRIASNINSGTIGSIAQQLNFTSLNPLTPSIITMDAGAQFNFAAGSGGSFVSDLKFTGSTGDLSGGVLSNTSGGTLTVSNAAFSSNAVLQTGGAIYNAAGSTTTVSGSTFDSNSTAQYYQGGSIYNSGTLTLTGDTFKNTANIVNSTYGGAILNVGTATITGSTFENLQVSPGFGYGGAIDNGGQLSISNSAFNGNIGANGGAIYTNGAGGGGALTLTNVNADSNSGGYGGVIDSVNYGTVNISGGTFTNNTGTGGVIALDSGTVTIDGATMSSNFSAWYGGAIYGTGGSVIISNSLFDSNKTGGLLGGAYGGAIDTVGPLTINGGTIFSNNVSYNGGAISASSLTIDGSLGPILFQKNSASGQGGAIYSLGALAISGATLDSNSSATQGGALYISGSGTGTISGSVFDSNTALSWGGAIYNAGILTLNPGNEFTNINNVTNATHGGAVFNSGASAQLNITGNTFTGLKTTYGGTIYNYTGGTAIISGSTFDSNTASLYGGVVFNDNSILTLNGGNEFINTANIPNAQNGGAIYNQGSSAKLTISGGNNTFTGMKASGNGGVIWNDGAAVDSNNDSLNTISGAAFNSNTAGNYGGAIYNSGGMIISGSAFDSNTTNIGGAIFNQGGTVTLSDSIFDSNTAAIGGAAIASGNGKVTISGSTFDSNTSVWYGGAIYNYGGVAAAISGSTFDSNTASQNGGAIYNDNSALTLNAGNEFKNTADVTNAQLGGAIYNTGASAQLTITGGNNTFTGMKASVNGGAIWNSGTAVDGNNDSLNIISGAAFDSNTAGASGGAVYNTGILTLNAGNIFNNASYDTLNPSGPALVNAASGGAVFNSGASSQLTITNNSFLGMRANYGGAIYNSGGTIGISGSTFDSNTTANYGGAIYNTNGVLNLNAGNMFNNTAGVSTAANGGAIYNTGASSQLTITGNTFTDMKTSYNGGAIYTGGGSTAISGSTFDSNASSGWYGGAIYNDNAALTLNAGNAFKNTAGLTNAASGGAIFNIGASAQLTITDNSFKGLKTSYDSGAIYNSNGTVSISGSTFDSNIAGTTGGAIFNSTGVLTLNDGNTFINTDNATNAARGGAIYNNSGTVTITLANSFSGLKASDLGGAIFNAAALNLTSAAAGYVTFSGNTAGGVANDIYNIGTININGLDGDVVLGDGISGTSAGSVVKSGAGRFLVNGDSSSYLGSFSQSAGSTIFTAGFFGGSSVVSGGILQWDSGTTVGAGSLALNTGGELDITSADNFALNTFTVSGDSTGIINKTGGGTITINSNVSGFLGTYTQNAGSTVVTAAGRMFGGRNFIDNGSSLTVTSGNNVYYNATLGSGSALTHYDTTPSPTDLGNGLNIGFAAGASGASMTFGAAAPATTATYNLIDNIGNSLANSVTFNNSTVTLDANDTNPDSDYTGATLYTFNNSTIDLRSADPTVRDVSFTSLTVNNSALSFDVALVNNAGALSFISDTLTAANPGGNPLALGVIKVLNPNEETGVGLGEHYIANVLNGGLQFVNQAQTTFSTTAYMYQATAAANPNIAGSTDVTGILLDVLGAADENSLYKMNALAGSRGFNFSFNSTYNIGVGLGPAAAGNFTVQGFDPNNPAGSVLSGAITTGPFAGDKGSFFNLANATNFTLENLTVQDAYTYAGDSAHFVDPAGLIGLNGPNGNEGNGSVLSMSNAAAAATVYNVILKNNKAAGNGGAIYAAGGQLAVADSTFDSNTAGNEGGAIYNAGTNTVLDGVAFTNNSAMAGGALYNAGSMENITADFTGNHVHDPGYTYGGAIYNSWGGTIGQITGHFTGNYADGSSDAYSFGGAIFNDGGAIAGITGDFTDNYAISSSSFGSYGGAVYNSWGTIGDITGNFTGNHVMSQGGAIYNNEGTISNITGTFIGNYASGSTSTQGGAIYNEAGGILTIGGNTLFAGNSAVNGLGGAIYNADILTLDSTAGNIVFGDQILGLNRAADAASGNDIYNDGGTINITGGAGAVAFNSGIAGTGAINKSGAGALIINGDSSNYTGSFIQTGGATVASAAFFAGGTTVTGGTLELAQGSSLASGAAIALGGTGALDITSDDNFTINDLATAGGGGALNKYGYGTLTLTGTTATSTTFNGDMNLYHGITYLGEPMTLNLNNFYLADDGVNPAVFDMRSDPVNVLNTVNFVQDGKFYMSADANTLAHDSVTASGGASTVNAANIFVTLINPVTLTAKITLSDLFSGVYGGDLAPFNINNITNGNLLGPRAGAKLLLTPIGIDLLLYLRNTNLLALGGLSHNQTQAAYATDFIANESVVSADMQNVIDSINNLSEAGQRKALNEMHGAFLANAIMSASFNTGRRNLYGRITPREYKDACLTCSKTPVAWAQGFGVQNILKATPDSPGDFKSNGWGAQAGMDIWNSESSVGGLYVGYGNNSMTQVADKGAMQSYSFGGYGGWYGEKWNVKSSVSLGYQDYDTTRNMTLFGKEAKAKFNTQNVNADVMAEYKIPAGEVNFKPFIGLQGGLVRNNSFDETGAGSVSLSVDGGNYFNAGVFGGLGIEEKLAKFRWYGDLHANIIAAGGKNTLTSAFAEDKSVKMDIYSAEQGAVTYGATLGGEYQLSNPLSIYANASADMGNGSNGYYGNIGLNYKFCCGKKDGCAVKKIVMPPPAPQPAPVTVQPAPAPVLQNNEDHLSVGHTLTIPGNNFAWGSYAVSRRFDNYLAGKAAELQGVNFNRIIIAGHTDNTGNKHSNQLLSELRAGAVADVFIKHGVPSEKIRYSGKGDTAPKADNSTREGRAANRRVEVTVE